MNVSADRPRPSLWAVDSAASTSGNLPLRALEESRVAAAAGGANGQHRGGGEQRDRPDDDQRVEQPRQLADEEVAGVAQRASEPVPARAGPTAAACGVKNVIETVASVPSRTVVARAFVFCGERCLRLVELVLLLRRQACRSQPCARARRSSPGACAISRCSTFACRCRSWMRTRCAVTSPSWPSRSTASSTLRDRHAQHERCRPVLSRSVHVDGRDVAAVAARDLHRPRRDRWRADPRRRARGATRCTCSGASSTAAVRVASVALGAACAARRRTGADACSARSSLAQR